MPAIIKATMQTAGQMPCVGCVVCVGGLVGISNQQAPKHAAAQRDTGRLTFM